MHASICRSAIVSSFPESYNKLPPNCLWNVQTIDITAAKAKFWQEAIFCARKKWRLWRCELVQLHILKSGRAERHVAEAYSTGQFFAQHHIWPCGTQKWRFAAQMDASYAELLLDPANSKKFSISKVLRKNSSVCRAPPPADSSVEEAPHPGPGPAPAPEAARADSVAEQLRGWQWPLGDVRVLDSPGCVSMRLCYLPFPPDHVQVTRRKSCGAASAQLLHATGAAGRRAEPARAVLRAERRAARGVGHGRPRVPARLQAARRALVRHVRQRRRAPRDRHQRPQGLTPIFTYYRIAEWFCHFTFRIRAFALFHTPLEFYFLRTHVYPSTLCVWREHLRGEQ